MLSTIWLMMHPHIYVLNCLLQAAAEQHVRVACASHAECLCCCRQLLESMFEWLVPPMLRVATRLVRAPLPMQDLNLVASCIRLLDAMLLPDLRDKPQLIAEMSENVQMVRVLTSILLQLVHTSCRSASLALQQCTVSRQMQKASVLTAACPKRSLD